MRVLVTGATGFVGSRLVPALIEAGHEVRALTRDANRYNGPAMVFEGDILEPGSFEHAIETVDTAYYLIHSMEAGPDFAARDRQAAHNFGRAASQYGVSRVVYLGGLGETRERLSEHLLSRREVETILADGAYDLTTLRAAVIIGAGSSGFAMVEQLIGRLPVLLAPKWARTQCQPIAVADVIAYLVGVLDVPETAGETYDIGGPEVLTYRELIERTADIAGRPLLVVPVPVLSPTLSAYWVALVTDIPRTITHPLIVSLKNTAVADDTRIEELVRIERTDFETAVERALGRHSPDARVADVKR